MTIFLIIGICGALYMALLAVSAWRQGEFRQFMTSLLVLAAVGAFISGAVAFAMYLDGP